MNVRNVAAILACLALLAGCSSMDNVRHEYLMRGQVVEVTGKDAVICVGSKDGASAGQVLSAYRIAPASGGGSAKSPAKWERVSVGSVRISQVIDEHFARAEITAGEVQVNNLVELSP